MFGFLDGFLQVELGHNFRLTGNIVHHYRWPSNEHIWQNLKTKIKNKIFLRFFPIIEMVRSKISKIVADGRH